ncbi:serine/threonine-protein kinase [Pleurocapsa sp. PCC 7319]|uniref:serine/threonine-protein kinase n=1 Tax=Pleurocapsa sp. PCC 7319 TaxID=118161 RepID=UPI000345BB05|nr:serine/threonine-protein kinase [Pleurocapsa sp. PCC 7319]
MKGKILASRYKIIDYIASGGFGRTYLAEDIQLPSKVKCVVKQLYPSIEDPKFLAVARRLFKTEASTLHNLGNHDQIPKLLAYFEEEEKFYLVQQYIEGQTLGKELNPSHVWSEAQIIELLNDSLNILKYIHAKGVIHRDIKPDNLIRRNSDHKLVLVDFGTVKNVLNGQTNIGQLTVPVGTQGYMPTEQARGKPRPTSDLYALGIICIQALTGVEPLDLEEDDEGELIWESLADISPQLAEILTKITRYHFKDRYQSAEEVLQALTPLLDKTISKSDSASANEPSSSSSTEFHNLTPVSASPTIDNGLPPTSVIDGGTSHYIIGQTSNFPAPQNSQAVASKIRPFPDANYENISEPAQPAGKSKNRKILGVAIACGVAIMGGMYLFIRQPITDNQPNTPDSPNELPSSPTERINQGEGFRKDL